MKTMKPLPLAALCGLLLASANAQAVSCQNSIPPSNPDEIYIVHGNGTVTDTRTGLMWKQCVEGRSGADCSIGSPTPFTWATALTLTEDYSFAGHDDWRLPNIKELRSLVEECRTGPAINDTFFPVNGASLTVWSGSPDANYSNIARYVNFSNGITPTTATAATTALFVLCAADSFLTLCPKTVPAARRTGRPHYCSHRPTTCAAPARPAA